MHSMFLLGRCYFGDESPSSNEVDLGKYEDQKRFRKQRQTMDVARHEGAQCGAPER